MSYESEARAERAPGADGFGGRRGQRGIRRFLTFPLAIASTVAVTLGIVQPAEAAPSQVKRQPKAKATSARPALAAVASTAAPAEYVVGEGDTVSGIAERFGLATAEVLATNGLSWSSLIFPGQRLALPGSGVRQEPTAAPIADIPHHIVVAGDTMSGIAAAHGVDLDELISANGLGRQSLIFPGQAIVLPPPTGAGVGPPPPPPAPVQPAPPAAPPATAPDPPADAHLVADGDTLWDIAAANDVSVQELITANALDPAGVIIPGQALVIPRPVAVTSVASVTVALTDEMRQNARIIVDVGRALGVPDHGIVIALAAAAQESGLTNAHHGDLDSLGLFQQRPSQGWGTVEEVLDPVRAATAFYGGAGNPNAGRTLGLLDIAGWEAMTVTQAAQAVQSSAFADHYARWEASARAWLSELG
ncbi:LysM peptidoglycan-binding domain-containing protein [Agromyces ramosus]|uniref:LysM repeat protein n=1 Tax=Agromyces ramosus TaxID=33879 RepID=A0ABU0RDL0_9MICO|nr:LysM peptidoglycan-binding domain-containing protein [Agromyces ramosus]MDQ0895857.1 LysM repeat protein [Agromyces ramosus]